MLSTIAIRVYASPDGKSPFTEWLLTLDKTARVIIDTRLARVRGGNFGDCKLVKGSKGLYELRIDYGPGYRIYFGKVGSSFIILLWGGDKSKQKRDIAKADGYLQEIRSREGSRKDKHD